MVHGIVFRQRRHWLAYVQKFVTDYKDRLKETAKKIIFLKTRILKLEQAPESPRRLVRTQLGGPQPKFLIQCI